VSVRVGSSATSSPFPKAASEALDNSQLRRNVRHATDIIQLKRQNMTGELPDWEELRTAGHAIKSHTLRYLDVYLE
jgi:L-lactate dehydrogenase complex protein LldF